MAWFGKGFCQNCRPAEQGQVVFRASGSGFRLGCLELRVLKNG